MLLAGPVRVAAALGEKGAHGRLVVVGLVAEAAGELVPEVDVRVLVVDPVGRAGGQQFADRLDDLRDRLDRADEVGRRYHPQRLHVLAEQRGLAHREHDPVFAVAFGALQQRIVDVGDVLHVVHLVTVVQPDPVDQVECQVGRGMAEMRRVVRGDAADVHPRDGPRFSGPDLTGGGVEEVQGAWRARHLRHGNR